MIIERNVTEEVTEKKGKNWLENLSVCRNLIATIISDRSAPEQIMATASIEDMVHTHTK